MPRTQQKPSPSQSRKPKKKNRKRTLTTPLRPARLPIAFNAYGSVDSLNDPDQPLFEGRATLAKTLGDFGGPLADVISLHGVIPVAAFWRQGPPYALMEEESGLYLADAHQVLDDNRCHHPLVGAAIALVEARDRIPGDSVIYAIIAKSSPLLSVWVGQVLAAWGFQNSTLADGRTFVLHDDASDWISGGHAERGAFFLACEQRLYLPVQVRVEGENENISETRLIPLPTSTLNWGFLDPLDPTLI